MRFIEGIGYVDDTTAYPARKTNPTEASEVSFDSILARETGHLSGTPAPVETTRSLDDIFREASETYGVSYDLLKAIAYNESGFRADATSYVGAMGIMQLMPSTAQSLGVTDAYDPYQNIMGGAKLLSQLDKLYNGDTTLMIAAYNAGSGSVAKYGGVPPFKETQNYVAKVLATLESGAANNVATGNVTYTAGTTDLWAAYQAGTTGNVFSNEAIESAREALDKLFSYSDYQKLLLYFDKMMQILENLNGSLTDDEDDTYFNGSLYG